MQVACVTLDCTVDEAGADCALLQEQVKCHQLVQRCRCVFAWGLVSGCHVLYNA